MDNDMRKRLVISPDRVEAINAILMNPDMRVMVDFFDVVARYGTPEEINKKAAEARRLPNLFEKVKAKNPAYIDDLEWLIEQRDKGRFIGVADFRRKVLGDKADRMTFADESAVTLEVSACQYFPWAVQTVRRSLEEGILVPGRFIRVRKMKEQEEDGDLLFP